jgi:hypothetical protein
MTKTASVLDTSSGAMVTNLAVPSDAAPKPGVALSGYYVTRLVAVVPLTAFYKDYMGLNGWTFEPDYSVLDPNVGVTKRLGFSTIQT